MASGTINSNEAHKINITGNVVDGIISIASTGIPGTPILAYDSGGWNWLISRSSSGWRFAGLAISGTSIGHPSDGARNITVIYVSSVN